MRNDFQRWYLGVVVLACLCIRPLHGLIQLRPTTNLHRRQHEQQRLLQWSGSSFTQRHSRQSMIQTDPSSSASTTTMLGLAFLPPPSGDENKKSELGEIGTALLTFVGVVAVLASPIGAILFTLFNSFLALIILLPLGGLVAFNVWQYFNTITGTCPNCTAPVKVLKDESPSVCFTCGAIVQAKDGKIYLSNINNNSNGYQGNSIFSSLLQEREMSSTATKSSSVTKTTTTVIDVDVKRDD